MASYIRQHRQMGRLRACRFFSRQGRLDGSGERCEVAASVMTTRQLTFNIEEGVNQSFPTEKEWISAIAVMAVAAA